MKPLGGYPPKNQGIQDKPGSCGHYYCIGKYGQGHLPSTHFAGQPGTQGECSGPTLRPPRSPALAPPHICRASTAKALTASSLEGSQFNGHSFCIGAVTSASAEGVTKTTIKLLRWCETLVYHRYIRPSSEDLSHISQQLF